MGPTVSSMFAHVGHAAAVAGTPPTTTLAALALLAAALVVALALRRRVGPPPARRGGRSRRASARGLGGALTALAGGGAGAGPALRVLSRLALGPGRYLCMVEAGDRVILVAVGGEVRLLGEVEDSLPRSRRRREAAARQLLVDRVAGLEAVRGDGAVVEFPARAAAAEAAAEPAADERGPSVAEMTGPNAITAALLERYVATAAATAGGEGAGGDADLDDRESAAYFSRLLDDAIERMEAAEDRILRRGPRRGASDGQNGEAAAAAAAWSGEGAGL